MVDSNKTYIYKRGDCCFIFCRFFFFVLLVALYFMYFYFVYFKMKKENRKRENGEKCENVLNKNKHVFQFSKIKK